MRESVRAELLNLLVVDDERSVRESLREAAGALGFTTLVAESAEAAYRIIETHSVDVVLLDLKLPGASGQEVLRELRQRRPQAVVVVITGNPSVDTAVQTMKDGH